MPLLAGRYPKVGHAWVRAKIVMVRLRGDGLLQIACEESWFARIPFYSSVDDRRTAPERMRER